MFNKDLLQTIIDQSKKWREVFATNSKIYKTLTSLINQVEEYQKTSYEVEPDDPEIPEPKTK